jgi:hypothetical protein
MGYSEPLIAILNMNPTAVDTPPIIPTIAAISAQCKLTKI